MARRTDANQREIVQCLRDLGTSVYITSMVEHGFPDIVAGYCGFNYLLELKNGDLPPSKQKLTQMEQNFHGSWRGQVKIISSVDEAIAFIKDIKFNPINHCIG